MTVHRHKWTVTRRMRCGDDAMVRECACGTRQRFCYGRWVRL